MAEDSASPTSVYRYYDRFGILIYVGITARAGIRNREHNATKEWWPFVVRQEVDHYPTREAASGAEQMLIASMRPAFNVVHNTSHKDIREWYLTTVGAMPPEVVVGIKDPHLLSVLPERRLPLYQYPRESEFLCSLPAHVQIARLIRLDKRVPVRTPRRIMTGVRAIKMRGDILVVETKIPLPPLRSAAVKIGFTDGERRELRLHMVFIDPVHPETIEECQRRRTGRPRDGRKRDVFPTAVNG